MNIDYTHPWVQEYRLPVVSTMTVYQPYIVALVINDRSVQRLVYTTYVSDYEAAIISCYIDYIIVSRYGQKVRGQMKENIIDLLSGYDSVLLHKLIDGNWCYRCESWDTNILYPEPGCCSMGLVELLDHIEMSEDTGSIKEEWISWKREHEIFQLS